MKNEILHSGVLITLLHVPRVCSDKAHFEASGFAPDGSRCLICWPVTREWEDASKNGAESHLDITTACDWDNPLYVFWK